LEFFGDVPESPDAGDGAEGKEEKCRAIRRNVPHAARVEFDFAPFPSFGKTPVADGSRRSGIVFDDGWTAATTASSVSHRRISEMSMPFCRSVLTAFALEIIMGRLPRLRENEAFPSDAWVRARKVLGVARGPTAVFRPREVEEEFYGATTELHGDPSLIWAGAIYTTGRGPSP